MLRRVRRTQSSGATARIAIVASEYNARYVDSMLRQAERVLRQAGARKVKLVRVPGAFEIPAVVARLLQSENHGLDAVVCLGVILRGETAHAQLLAESVSQALAQLQVQHTVPVVHGVLLFDNEHQAKVRCLGREHNRGAEAASTALTMARIMRQI